MADSWQQIDDDGVTMDWTSVDTLALADLWHPLNAVIRAIDERVEASGVSPSAAVYPITADRLDPFNNYSPTYGVTEKIYSTVTDLMALAVPYWLSGGDYTGQAYLPGMTEALMLARIGDAARETYGQNANLQSLRAFIFQNYKILNELKWFYDLGTAASSTSKYGQSAADWAAAVSAFNAASWSPGGPLGSYAYYSGSVSGGTYTAYALGGTYDFADTDLDYDYDGYGTVHKYHVLNIFQPLLGFASLPSGVQITHSGSKTGAGVLSLSHFEDSDFTSETLLEPADEGDEYTYSFSPHGLTIEYVGNTTYGIGLVKKFDVAGGMFF